LSQSCAIERIKTAKKKVNALKPRKASREGIIEL